MAKDIKLQKQPNLAGQPQVFLRERDFNALVWNKGYDVIVEKALRCPCRNKPDHQAVINCRNCGGTGWAYINPTKTSLVLQSMNYDTKFKDWGEEKIGMGKATFMKQEHISFMDKLTITNGEMITTEVLYPKVWSTGKLMCRTLYPIVDIEHCYLFNGSNEKLTRIRLDEDFTIEKGNYIILNDSLNRENMTLSIRYHHNPVFYVIDIPRVMMVSPEMDKEKGGVVVDSKFPLLANVRLAHYVIGQNNYSGDWLFDNSDYDFCKDGGLETEKVDSCKST